MTDPRRRPGLSTANRDELEAEPEFQVLAAQLHDVGEN